MHHRTARPAPCPSHFLVHDDSVRATIIRSMVPLHWIVEASDPPARLDVALARRLDTSRSRAARLIASGAVHVNDRAAAAGYLLRPGDSVQFTPVADGSAIALAPNLHESAVPADLDIIYEDAHILVINKPRGLVVHPAPGHAHDTLANILVTLSDELSEIGGEDRPGIVHRLDKDTTGLMVVAKTDDAHRSLQAQIQSREAERIYTGIVWGSPAFETATVRASIGRHPRDRKRMAVLPDGSRGSREAVTDLAVLGRHGPFAEVEARLQTGRTHQIRVHCSYIGHPVVGDPVYGGIRKLPADRMDPVCRDRIQTALAALGGQALHAGRLAIRHPVTGEAMTFDAPPPPDMALLRETLRQCFPA